MTFTTVLFSTTSAFSADTDKNLVPVLNDLYYTSENNNLRLRPDSVKVIGTYAIGDSNLTRNRFTSPLIANSPYESNAIALGTAASQICDSVNQFSFPAVLARPNDNVQAICQSSNTSSVPASAALLLSNQPIVANTSRVITNEVFVDLSSEATGAANTWSNGISLAGSNLADVESGNYAVLGWRCISPTLIGARLIMRNRELPVSTIPSRSVNDRQHPLERNCGAPYAVYVADGSSTPQLSLCSTTGAESPVSATFYLSRID
ncbi:MAG: hypothetical protein JKY75_00510 [Erythrobacter sp.]|jgi:hypothetical protein|nr:hypothetical protein [Erythrobacter sp.]